MALSPTAARNPGGPRAPETHLLHTELGRECERTPDFKDVYEKSI